MDRWVKRWNTWMAPTKLPGVWKVRDGGHFVRARVTDPTTGRQDEIKKVLTEIDNEVDALKWLDAEKARIKAGGASVLAPKQRFADYAPSLLERKLKTGEIKSARGRERWIYPLVHLIQGTKGVSGFGELFMDQIQPMHFENWRAGIGELILAKDYSPITANGWLNILRHIMARATRELRLGINPIDGVKAFKTTDHETYTEENPNALAPEELTDFLVCMYEEFAIQYAMSYLGFATGLRPSHMRPLRRKGPTPDILWDEGVVLVRRSHTLNAIMNTTKTGRRDRIHVPAEVMGVLRWHVDTQLTTPEQQASELLFPADDGGCRSEGFLAKVFPKVCRMIGLKKKLTPKGMRRTFNDLSRLVSMDDVIQKSISGWTSPRMRELYSTVHPAEQRESIGRVLRLVQGGKASEGGLQGGAHEGESGLHSQLATS
ncbi:site-specific integrase [Pendulispora rubella]|uniref:Site-specific integrase n=1 Tax=Pendulispora rubella TaxID=2741070 RepID=A0ABZ2L6R2_9BACT